MMVVTGFFNLVMSNGVILWLFFDEVFLFYHLVFAAFSFQPLMFILSHVILFLFIEIGL